jgi:arylsulfatase A-like enzyme
MVEFLDHETGRILAALRDAGVERDTLVLFTSDNGGNGTARNAPFRGRKSQLAEGGIRVPPAPPCRRAATAGACRAA